MGVKRKAPDDDKLKPDKYQCIDTKSPDMLGAKEAKSKTKFKAKTEAKPEAKARGDIIEEGLEEAIEMAGQESDIVINNIVQPNQYLTIGFLEHSKRLNVAISQACCLLMIVGNATMFSWLERGMCFIVNKENINTEGQKHWPNLLKW
uniref:DNA2/NAM7 helicase-like C-terminal domain-containing protein n=1 Tax=Romanomermis culicivorax TaxID=13658 RepID=A0A915HUH8_ROMCU